MILSLHTTVCQYASDMITKYNHRRTRESAGLSVNRMLLCDLSRAHAIGNPLPLLPRHPSPLRPPTRCAPLLPPFPPPRRVPYILYQTHPSVHPLKHIAARKIRIDHAAGRHVYVHSYSTHAHAYKAVMSVPCRRTKVCPPFWIFVKRIFLVVVVTCPPVRASVSRVCFFFFYFFSFSPGGFFLFFSFFATSEFTSATKRVAWRYRNRGDRNTSRVCVYMGVKMKGLMTKSLLMLVQ